MSQRESGYTGQLTAGQRAAEAIQANPLKSNRAIAEELGISEPTVRRARNDAPSPDAPRIGRDGKRYPGVRTSGRDGPSEPPTCVSVASPSLAPPEPPIAPTDSPESLPGIVTPSVTQDVTPASDERQAALAHRRAMLRGDTFE